MKEAIGSLVNPPEVLPGGSRKEKRKASENEHLASRTAWVLLAPRFCTAEAHPRNTRVNRGTTRGSGAARTVAVEQVTEPGHRGGWSPHLRVRWKSHLGHVQISSVWRGHGSSEVAVNQRTGGASPSASVPTAQLCLEGRILCSQLGAPALGKALLPSHSLRA